MSKVSDTELLVISFHEARKLLPAASCSRLLPQQEDGRLERRRRSEKKREGGEQSSDVTLDWAKSQHPTTRTAGDGAAARRRCRQAC